jgi:hypothetical protein
MEGALAAPTPPGGARAVTPPGGARAMTPPGGARAMMPPGGRRAGSATLTDLSGLASDVAGRHLQLADAVAQMAGDLREREAAVQAQQERLDKEIYDMRAMYAAASAFEQVEFTVGPRAERFVVARADLLKDEGSMLHTAFSGRHQPPTAFPTCDADAMERILEFLRYGELRLPTEQSARTALRATATFLQVNKVVAALEPGYDTRYLSEADAQSKLTEDIQREEFVQNRAACVGKGPFWTCVKVYGRAHDGDDTAFHRVPRAALPYTMFFTHRRPFGGSEGAMPIESTKRAFQDNLSFVTGGLLKYVEWDNVLLAGGAVLAALQRCPDSVCREEPSGSKEWRKLMTRWHRFRSRTTRGSGWSPGGSGFGLSDLDLFIYGLKDEAAATEKLIALTKQLARAASEETPYWSEMQTTEVDYQHMIAVRTEHAVTFVAGSFHPHAQVVLRLYASPAEVLMGFDVDCCCVGYDGTDVWALPRAVRAIERSCNLVDPGRQSASYEHRLAKYGKRGFAVAVPGVGRSQLDWSIYSKPAHKLNGLAYLMRLEMLDQLKVTKQLDVEYNIQGNKRNVPRVSRAQAATGLTSYGTETMEVLATSTRAGTRAVPPDLEDYWAQVKQHECDYSSAFIPHGPTWDAEKVKNALQDKLYLPFPDGWEAETERMSLARKAARVARRVEAVKEPLRFVVDTVGTSRLDMGASFSSRLQPGPGGLLSRVLDTANCAELLRFGWKFAIPRHLEWLTENPGRQLTGSFQPTDGDWYAQAVGRVALA